VDHFGAGGFRVPMSSPDLTEAERQVVAEVLNTPRLSMGPYEEAFETAVKEYSGVNHAIAVSSGTAGLHLCIRAAGISDGDWVITTPFSFVASSNVMLYERAIPIFVDVDARTGNIDTKLVAEAVEDLMQGGSVARRWHPRKGIQPGGKLKAILPVDVFGQPVDYDPLLEIASAYSLNIIEDSCEALGSTYKNRNAGTFGDAAVFAFYPNKQITTGEGGIVITNDENWASAIRSMRNQGRAPGDTWLDHTYLGYNYRLNELSAALGAIQMRRVDELIAKRQQVVNWYLGTLENIQGIEVPQVLPTTTRMSWFVFVIRFDPGIDRDATVGLLKDRGIPARPYFMPIHLQPFMQDRFDYQHGDFPVTEDLGRRGLALPFSSVMSEEQVGWVCEALKEVVEIA
jgi:dTDP-4-amino-4,6-dideoxygalactose transaminase